MRLLAEAKYMKLRLLDWMLLCAPFLVAAMISARLLLATSETTESVTILVAASTQHAVTEIAQAFEKNTGIKIIISSGPSNALANQIINGAPADLFLSANQEWADQLKIEGLADDVRPMLSNGLVIVVPQGNPAKVREPSDLATVRVKRLALAGENVPAGKYAQQSLEAHTLYRQLATQGKIVRGQDVMAVLNFVERAEAEAGIVYTTDAMISRKIDTACALDPRTYDKIIYPMVLTKRGKQNVAAVTFGEYLVSDRAADVFKKHGFLRIE